MNIEFISEILQMYNYIWIAAADEEGGIGYRGKLPWNIIEDMICFKQITLKNINNKKNVVIMGKNTYFSIPIEYRPLKGRINIILTKSPELFDTNPDISQSNLFIFDNLENAIKGLNKRNDIGIIFIIGGASLFEYSYDHNFCDIISLTQISYKSINKPCDTYCRYLTNDFISNNFDKQYEYLMRDDKEIHCKLLILTKKTSH